MHPITLEVRDSASILRDAAKLLRERDKLTAKIRELDDQLRGLGQEFNRAEGLFGTRPEHLRHACEARGLLNAQ